MTIPWSVSFARDVYLYKALSIPIIQVFNIQHFARSSFCFASCALIDHSISLRNAHHQIRRANKISLCCNLVFTVHFILCFIFQALCNAVENEKVEKIRSILEHNPHLDVTHRCGHSCNVY